MSSKGKLPVKKAAPESLGKSFIEYTIGMVTSVYVFLMLVIFPLYMEDKYLNMGEAKYHFFKWVSLTFLCVLSVLFIIYLYANAKEAKFTKMVTNASSTDIFATAFLIISFLSFMFSSNKAMAFEGYSGWYMGFTSQMIFVFAFFYISKFWKWSPHTIILAMFSAGIVYLIAVLQRFNFDIFKLYSNLNNEGILVRLDDKYIEKFVSTLGQTTWYSSYAVLMLPFGMFWYYRDEKPVSRILSAIFIILGAASLCTVNSDSAYAAIGVIMMVFFWFAIENNKSFGRFLEIVILFLATFRVVGILQTLFPERMIVLLTGDEAMTNFVNHSVPMLALLIFVVLLYIVFRAVVSKSTDDVTGKCSFDVSKFKFLRKIMLAAFIVIVWAVVLLIILVSTHKIPAGNAISNVTFFNFDYAWGNCRGFNWRMAMRAYSNASLKDFLLGVGPDCFALSMNRYCYQEVFTFYEGLQLACAHNEWLNMLITEGLFGLIAYAGIFITEFVRLGKIAHREPMAIPCMAAIAAYVAHNIFCYQQCICTSVIFIVLGIGEMIIVHTKKEMAKEN